MAVTIGIHRPYPEKENFMISLSQRTRKVGRFLIVSQIHFGLPMTPDKPGTQLNFLSSIFGEEFPLPIRIPGGLQEVYQGLAMCCVPMIMDLPGQRIILHLKCLTVSTQYPIKRPFGQLDLAGIL